MKNAKVIALSAITAAFATVLLVLGNFFTALSLSGAFLASIVMMMPLAKNSYKGAIFAYLAAVILTGIFSGFFTRWDALLPFAVFTGLHPIVNCFLESKNFNKIAGVIIKDVWFVGALVLTHVITKIYVGDNDFINTYIFPILIIGGAILFPVYDYIMASFFRMVVALIRRLKL